MPSYFLTCECIPPYRLDTNDACGISYISLFFFNNRFKKLKFKVGLGESACDSSIHCDTSIPNLSCVAGFCTCNSLYRWDIRTNQCRKLIVF